jgi:aromatic-L-amino-acid/L-tryptophan decarboxylase
MPDEVREHHKQDVCHEGEDIKNVIEEFKQYILPYGSGNTHPGFMGWVQGGLRKLPSSRS